MQEFLQKFFVWLVGFVWEWGLFSFFFSLNLLALSGLFDAGKDRGQEERIRRLDGFINSTHMSLSKLREIVKDRETCLLQSTGSPRAGHDLVTEQQQLGLSCGTQALCYGA